MVAELAWPRPIVYGGFPFALAALAIMPLYLAIPSGRYQNHSFSGRGQIGARHRETVLEETTGPSIQRDARSPCRKAW